MNPLALLALFNQSPALFVETLFLMVVLMFLFLLFGATAAGIVDVTMVNVLITAISVIAAQWVVVVVLSIIPFIGGILGFIFSIVVMVYVLKINFNTTWIRAAKVLVLAVVAEVAAGLILKLYLGVGILPFIHQFFFVT
jgi:hypothetical protein